MTLHDMVPEHHHEEVLALVKRLSHAEVVEPCRSQRLTKDGRTLTVMITATALVTDAGDTYGIATTERAVDGLNEGLKK